MSNIIIGGFICEGETYRRFLTSIIKRTFEEIAFLCAGEIEVYNIICLNAKSDTFIETALKAAKMASDSGIMILCLHCDADANSDIEVFKNKISPA